jgi:tRNA(Ile)-lysidine synthase TilS/MesJ
MNPGYNKENLDLIMHNLEVLNIPAHIVESNIFEVANSQEKNPCYLCARMRRGVLYKAAKELGCNKIALGHHYDDVIETTLMNMLNSGSFQTMVPKLHSLNFEGMELIRPMYMIREKDIIKWANHNELKFIQCACKFTEELHNNVDEMSSKRYETKELIQSLLSYNELVEQNIFMAAHNVNIDMVVGYKKDGVIHNFKDEYKNKK